MFGWEGDGSPGKNRGYNAKGYKKTGWSSDKKPSKGGGGKPPKKSCPAWMLLMFMSVAALANAIGQSLT
jgi:hypothetical protein